MLVVQYYPLISTESPLNPFHHFCNTVLKIKVSRNLATYHLAYMLIYNCNKSRLHYCPKAEIWIHMTDKIPVLTKTIPFYYWWGLQPKNINTKVNNRTCINLHYNNYSNNHDTIVEGNTIRTADFLLSGKSKQILYA